MLSQRDTLGKYNADVLFLIVISTKHDALTNIYEAFFKAIYIRWRIIRPPEQGEPSMQILNMYYFMEKKRLMKETGTQILHVIDIDE